MTLYERLGGKDAIDQVVEKFYDIMVADEQVASFFKNTDLPRQRAMQKKFLALVSGGPNEYDGRDMKTVHAKLGIAKANFDRTWENLKTAFEACKAPEKEINELKEVIYSLTGDVVTK